MSKPEIDTKLISDDNTSNIDMRNQIKQLEARIAELENIETERRIAENKNKAKTDFLANISHEIRTPMNAIKSAAEILLFHKNLPDDVVEGLDLIYSSSDVLIGIINDILDFSKIEAGKLDLLCREYDVASLIQDSINMNISRKDNKDIKFEINIDENVPVSMIGDSLRIMQILNNLLSNAFKYTQKGSVTLMSYCRPGKTDDETIFVICIKDTGMGMTQEQMERMFEEYSRFNLEYGNTTEGTGLGLMITRRLIELMGGTIEVDSEYGKGTAFTVNLPQKLVNKDILGIEFSKTIGTGYKISKTRDTIEREIMPYGKVLIVDDSESNRYVAIGLLKPYMIQTDTAPDGKSALEKVKEGNIYDVIFMDYMMAGMDGIETANRLREVGYSEPIVALTANAMQGQEALFLSSGFDAFLSKPIEVKKLNKVLNKYIRDKQPPEVLNAACSIEYKKPEIDKTGDDFTGENNNDINKSRRLADRKIDGLDIHKGLSEFLNDKDIYLRVLRSYSSTGKDLLSTIKAYSEDEQEKYMSALHNIKGSAYSVFANKIGDLAGKLEKAAKLDDILYIKENNFILVKLMSKLISDIDDMLLSISQGNQKQSAEKPDPDLLRELLAACEDYSLDDVNKVMIKLESYQYNTGAELVSWLVEKADMMQYTQIIDILNEVLNS